MGLDNGRLRKPDELKHNECGKKKEAPEGVPLTPMRIRSRACGPGPSSSHLSPAKHTDYLMRCPIN